MRTYPGIVPAVVAAFILSTSVLHSANWPAWRGQNGNGVCAESNLPVEWGPTKNVSWKLPLPGPAGATPVVWDKRIFLTSTDGSDLILLCISTEGKELWRRTVSSGNRNVRGDEGNSAAPSPVTDGSYVWATMANGEIGCYDMAGKEIWKASMSRRYGPFIIAFGMVSTPVLDGDRLYFQFIHGNMRKPAGDEAVVVAVDKKTGKEIWKQVRKSDGFFENKHSYTSPVLYNDGKQKFLITHGADYAIAHSLDDGRELWRLTGLNPQNDPNRRYHKTLRFVASPAPSPGLIVVPTAKNGPVFGVNSAGKQLWVRKQNTPDVPSPIIHDGLVYLCRENGMLICLDGKSGKQIYMQRTHNQRHRASPVYGDGKIYLSARDGKVSVIRAGRKFQILGQNEFGEGLASSPSISNGTIYFRAFKHLWAIHKK